jgi:leader peptidase (prepilin peptidase)/N-methyltransferase
MELPYPFFEVLFFVFGALLGSFGNVVIYRLPEGKSVVIPRSHCQACGKTVPWYHNIPILSWLILRGRCFSCKAPFSIRYPLVELIMGILFLLLYLVNGLQWTTLEYAIFIFGLVVVSFIDIDHFILPDIFTLGGTVLGLLGAVLNPDRNFLDSFLGVLMGGGFLWLIAYGYWVLRKEEGMGGGDIKLLAWIGAVLGWKAIPLVILISSVSGSIIGILLMLKNKGNLKTVIPFGPYLVLGALVYLFADQDLSRWYFSLLFPSQE